MYVKCPRFARGWGWAPLELTNTLLSYQDYRYFFLRPDKIVINSSIPWFTRLFADPTVPCMQNDVAVSLAINYFQKRREEGGLRKLMREC